MITRHHALVGYSLPSLLWPGSPISGLSGGAEAVTVYDEDRIVRVVAESRTVVVPAERRDSGA